MSETIETTALAVIPASALPTIIAADTNDILGKLAAKVAAHKPDISTPSGRDKIRSLAAEIASGKMDLIRLGKGLTEGWRKSTKAVNEECNTIEARMDELKERVRAPLTEFENREKMRVAGHEAALAAMVEEPGYGQTETAAELQARIEVLMDWPARDWQEFTQRARQTLGDELDRTHALLTAALKREADAAELARLQAEEAERQRQEAARQQAEREAQIAAEAAEAARLAAEAKAAEEAAKAARKAREAQEATERAAREAQAKVEREKAAAEERAAKAERDRLAAIAAREEADRQAAIAAEQHERARVAAEAKAKADAEALAAKVETDKRAAADKAERERVAAVAAEQKRQADAAAAQKAAAEKRAKDKAHRARINNEALADIVMAVGLLPSGDRQVVDDIVKAVVVAIAKGAVRHVKISY